MIHLTIQTGHRRESPRAEVGDAVVAALAPLLRTGEHQLPGPPGYRLRVTVDGSALLATVVAEASGAPLVTSAVAPDAAALVALRGVLGARLPSDIVAPACVDDVHPALALDPEAAAWTGDLMRCIAWTWIEHRRGAS